MVLRCVIRYLINFGTWVILGSHSEKVKCLLEKIEKLSGWLGEGHIDYLSTALRFLKGIDLKLTLTLSLAITL